MRAFVAVIFAIGCGGEPVGRVCDLGTQMPAASEVVLASGSLDCVTRTCLRVPLTNELPPGSSFPTGTAGLCTAPCETDDDCESEPGSPCVGGFTCGIPVSVGPFCCQKFCVCKDYVENGELPELAACNADNPNNTCANLPGR
jgi:hypothetical protein